MSPRARANVVRIAVAAAVLVGVVWWMKARGDATSRTPVGAPVVVSGSNAPREGGGGGGGKGGPERVVPVQVVTAERVTFPVWLEGLGTVGAFQQVTVRPQVDGRLDKVLFEEGKPVKKGEVLAQIDPRPFRVKLLQAQGALARDRSQLEATKKNYERYKGLAAQNLVAQQQVEELGGTLGQYEGAVKIDQASVEDALLQLDYAQVKAPIDGVTGVRMVDAGNLVKASDPNGLVVITQLDPATVMFTIPQDKLPAVASALAAGEVAVEVWNRDGSKLLAKGKLAVLDNQINTATSTLRLKALVPNPQRILWPNAFVKARMLVETVQGALVVPAVAIQRGPQGVFVYVVGPDKTAMMKQVTVDLLTGDRALIGKGLEGGEQVVIEGASQLRPGGRVEVVTPGGKPDGGGKPEGRGPKQPAGSAAGPTPAKPPAAP